MNHNGKKDDFSDTAVAYFRGKVTEQEYQSAKTQLAKDADQIFDTYRKNEAQRRKASNRK